MTNTLHVSIIEETITILINSNNLIKLAQMYTFVGELL